MKRRHRLLKRQLKNVDLTEEQLEQLAPLLDAVDGAYQDFDNDVQHLETIVERSSQELFDANQQLKKNVVQISDQLDRVVGNIQEIIFETDLEGNWTYLNPAWEEFTGRAVKDSLGKHYSNFFKNVNNETIFQNVDFKEIGNKTFTQIIDYQHYSGEHRWAEVSLKVVSNEDGWYLGTIGSIVDITKLKKTETDLIEAKDKADIANKAKDEFLSTMSHEIRTPLNAVIGISHLLLLENPKPSQLEYLNSLKISSEHLLGLVNDILDFSKIESGNFELENNSFSLDYVLNALQTTLKQRAAEKRIEFVVQKGQHIPDSIKGDSMRLSQILTNLAGNAVKFTEEGSVTINLRVVEDLPAKSKIRFDIIDTGIGIAEDKIDLVFKSFTQANSDTTRKYGGTGLGLSISKNLIEMMGGSLNVESKEGEGTTFWFEITFDKTEGQTMAPRKDAGKVGAYSSLNGMNVLIVEDYPMNVMVLKRFFKKWDVNFDVADNGQIGVEFASKKNYDLVLMDLQMPVMNGYDSARNIRDNTNEYNKTIPIYALSASAFMDVQVKVGAAGMNGHISKPFNPKDLFEVLKSHAPNV